jgi:hypothetical protein
MKEARHLIEKKKREVEDLLLLVLAKAANYAHHPNFDKNDRLHKAAKHCQCAAHELFMASVALLEKPDG